MLQCKRTYLFANTGPGFVSFKDKDGDTTTVLNVGKKENSKSTVALSERENHKTCYKKPTRIYSAYGHIKF